MGQKKYIEMLMGAVKKAGEPEPSLLFKSNTSFTLKTENNLKNWNGLLEYSENGIKWNVWNGTEVQSSLEGNIYLRGTNNTVITGSFDKTFIFTNATNLKAIGNIECLLDWKTVERGEHPQMGVSCFAYIFDGCVSLIQPPELPATILNNSCYTAMFRECISLVEAPKLPATTLYTGCYNSMFRGCVSLIQPPELPATILSDTCYSQMLRNCTSLKISDTKTGNYQTPWRIPTIGEISTIPIQWNSSMITGTSGTFTSNPNINTTYYLDIT